MIPEISEKRNEIVSLCERHGVIRLGVFGSAARGTDFKPEKSDVDFLVLFDGRDRVDYIDRFLDLADDLEALLGRSVDLVTELSVQSPIFKAAVERDLEQIYARPAHQTAA
ncbi:nucleotidyltransferase domain-containing protein [soil metagenome]